MANINTAYGASSQLTCTLASLPSDTTTYTLGRQSQAVSNLTALQLDYLLAGKIKTGSSPTAGRIEVWAYAQLDDTPTYPDAITGSDAQITLTSADIKASGLRFVASLSTDTTTGRTYWFGGVSLASLFGGIVPKSFGLFVVNGTGVALDSSGSNHALYVTPVYAKST